MMDNEHSPLEGPESDVAVTDSNDDALWVSLAFEADKESTDFLDENYRAQFERNVAHFRSKHPPGSKYYTDPYKMRSRLFRPKTRSSIRSAEASFAEAAFGSREVFTVTAMDKQDPIKSEIAEFWQEGLNYHLQYNIPWFLISNAAFQEGKVYGVVFSKQFWRDGKPVVELIPVENIRFAPGASWIDPVNTSPYFIEKIPMFVDDVLEMVEDKDDYIEWIKYSREEIISAGKDSDQSKETLRSQREGGSDPKEDDDSKHFKIVWVHRNFIKYDGEDWEYYTLSSRKLLSKPVAVEKGSDIHLLGRNYRMGLVSIEAHRCIPSADVELGQDLQAEANDIANQRIDNIRLVLNKGYLVHRKGGVDLAALRSSRPGRIVQYDVPNSVTPDETNDVTSSSYAEQDRINHDMDDILGGFSSSSVASSRQLNETVGGMQLFNQSGNKIQGYSIRIFVETWVEPVLNDVLKLVMKWDERIDIFSYDLPKGMTREQLYIPMNVGVSVGLGVLDPKQKARAFVEALMTLGKIAPWQMAQADIEMISGEIFAPLGFRDGSKFFKEFVAPPEPQPDPAAQAKMAEVKLKEQDYTMRRQVEMAKLKQDRELALMKMALEQELTLKQALGRLDLDMDRLNLDILREMGQQEKTQRDREEMDLKMKMGEGI